MKNSAFTLAEILVTLGIIGIVAALTIPNITKKYTERAIITKYKKMYSTISNAYNIAIVEHGDPANWGIEDRAEFLNRITPYLNILEKCYNKKGCTSKGSFISLSGELIWQNLYDIISMPKVRLNDGSSIIMSGLPNPNCIYNYTNPDGSITPFKNFCASIYIVISDTKSANYKNYYGKDFFKLQFTRQGVYPIGYDKKDSTIKASCDKGNHGSGNGDTCGTWIQRYDNMDYYFK